MRAFDRERDRDAIERMWLETGWVKDTDKAWVEPFLEACHAIVADVDGEAEALAATSPGLIRYLDGDLSYCNVAAVTTSHVARHKSLATRLTAHAVAEGVERYGAQVAGLGMFEQGFYDRLGFGTGNYDHFVRFHPRQLRVPPLERAPVRLTQQDWPEIHESRFGRLRRHGGVVLRSPQMTHAAVVSDGMFGLGFRDASGALTHLLWFRRSGDPEHGPYIVDWMTYRSFEQFVELLSVIRSLGDQVRTVRIPEPPGVQLVDLLDRPLFHDGITGNSQYASGIKTFAWWQIRICDIAGCVPALSTSRDVAFNLELTDPIEPWLEDREGWRGVGGQYVVKLGRESVAARGQDDALPTMRATINAFSRLWLGVLPAPGLAATDDLEADATLLAELDSAIRLPTPRPDWDL